MALGAFGLGFLVRLRNLNDPAALLWSEFCAMSLQLQLMGPIHPKTYQRAKKVRFFQDKLKGLRQILSRV